MFFVVGPVDSIVVRGGDVDVVVLPGASVDRYLVVLVVENVFVVGWLDEIGGLSVDTFSVKDFVEERDIVDSVVDSCFELDISVVDLEDDTTGRIVVSNDETTLVVVDLDDETTCCVVWASDDDDNFAVVVFTDVGLGVDLIVVVTHGINVIIFGVDSIVVVVTLEVVDDCCCFVVE